MNRAYQMPNNYSDYYILNNYYNKNNDERLAGGFAFPFLLGGVTGAALAPAFYKPNTKPIYYAPYPYPYQYQYPYPPKKWF